MRDCPVHKTLARITGALKLMQIPYAVIGGMALNAHGYVRMTVDIDILVSTAGLKLLHERLVSYGYQPLRDGSRHLRDTESGVKMDFFVTGGFPGDGKSKTVTFPDPATCAQLIDGIHYVNLENLIELKLASGMTVFTRMRDLADVIELIKIRNLGHDFALKLHPYVREKYLELWHGVKNAPKFDHE